LNIYTKIIHGRLSSGMIEGKNTVLSAVDSYSATLVALRVRGLCKSYEASNEFSTTAEFLVLFVSRLQSFSRR